MSSLHCKFRPQSEIACLGSRSHFQVDQGPDLDSPWPNWSETTLRLFSNSQFFDCRTRMCTGVHALTTKKSLLPHGWLKGERFFFAHLFTQIASHEQPWRPHGQPVLVTKSAFTYARKKNIHSGGPRNKKCTYSTSKCLSVWAKNILGSSLMMAHDGHMGQTGYRNVRHRA
jgi:hypothetical protein